MCLFNIIQNLAFIPKIATSSKKAFCREWWERSSLFEHFNSNIFGSKRALQSHDVKNEINRVIYLVTIITSSLHIRNKKKVIVFYRTIVFECWFNKKYWWHKMYHFIMDICSSLSLRQLSLIIWYIYWSNGWVGVTGIPA